MLVEHRQASNLDDLLRILEDESLDDHYSVAWIDCLATDRSMGRGVFMRGHHAKVAELGTRLPTEIRVLADFEEEARRALTQWRYGANPGEWKGCYTLVFRMKQ